MDKKTEDLSEEQKRLLQQDLELWVSADNVWKADDARWEELWIKYYQWDRIKIRFMDSKLDDQLEVRSKMKLLKDGNWTWDEIDPKLIPFRDAMEHYFPSEATDHVAQMIWMEDEYYKWTFRTKRKFDLIPPFVKPGTPISADICNLYAETRESYIAGQFMAAVALCRAVVECCIRKKLRKESRDEFNLKESLGNLSRLNMITHETYTIADEIRLRANKILHSGAPLNEKEALTFINETKIFIEEFYKK
jgi:hypothetical protein